MPDRTETTKGRDESPYRQDPTAPRTGSSPDRVRDGKRVEHTAPSPNSQTTEDMTKKRWTKKEIIKWCDWRVNGPTSGTELRGIHKSMIVAILKLLRKP